MISLELIFCPGLGHGRSRSARSGISDMPSTRKICIIYPSNQIIRGSQKVTALTCSHLKAAAKIKSSWPTYGEKMHALYMQSSLEHIAK